MTDSLFDSLDDARRQCLMTRGWERIYTWGNVRWQRPCDKAWLSEEEAFKALERMEASYE